MPKTEHLAEAQIIRLHVAQAQQATNNALHARRKLMKLMREDGATLSTLAKLFNLSLARVAKIIDENAPPRTTRKDTLLRREHAAQEAAVATVARARAAQAANALADQ